MHYEKRKRKLNGFRHGLRSSVQPCERPVEDLSTPDLERVNNNVDTGYGPFAPAPRTEGLFKEREQQP